MNLQHAACESQLAAALALLEALVDSAALASEYKDMLEDFDDYEWQLRPGADFQQFTELVQKCRDGIAREDDAAALCHLASAECAVPLAVYMARAVELIRARQMPVNKEGA